MKVAVMQPYIFPYIGYFQLINAVDVFVFYDDVNYIKQGWVNRNRIIVGGSEHLFTVPLSNASSFSLIKDTQLHPVLYYKWKDKFLKSIEQSYKKAPYFNDIFGLIQSVFDAKAETISDLAIISVEKISAYLGLQTKFFRSSENFPESKVLERADRLISICKDLKASCYVNMIGGQELYTKEFFKDHNVDLGFLTPGISSYLHGNNEFIGGLSIIDVSMYNSKDDIYKMLNNFKIS